MRRRPAADDQQTLRRVYREHVDATYAFFAYSVGGTTAEDLTSSTFERVIRAWPRFDPHRASERTWIMVIARNLLIDHYRRDRERDSISVEEHPAILERLVQAEHPLNGALMLDELRCWLDPLSERERTVLALRYAADLEGMEIARVLGLSTSNVHQILSRSLRRLRAISEAETAESHSA